MKTPIVSKPVPEPSAENAKAVSGPSTTPTVSSTDENPNEKDPQQDSSSEVIDIQPHVVTLDDVGPKKTKKDTKPYRGPRLSPNERRLLSGYEKTVRENLDGMFEHHLKVGRAMLEIQTKKLYRERFKTWDGYCTAVYNMARSRSYELIAAAEVVENLSAAADISVVPESERQIRPLTLLKKAEDRAEAWNRAVEIAAGKEVTGTIVRQAVDEFKTKAKSKKTASADNKPDDVVPDWAKDIMAKLVADGAEEVEEQPFNWPNNAVDLKLKDGRFVKIIETLDLETAACAIELREKCSECIILIYADENSDKGLDISESGDEIVDSFDAPFNAIAEKIGALLEDQGSLFMAGDMDDPAKVTWHRLSREIVEKKGLLCLVSE